MFFNLRNTPIIVQLHSNNTVSLNPQFNNNYSQMDVLNDGLRCFIDSKGIVLIKTLLDKEVEEEYNYYSAFSIEEGSLVKEWFKSFGLGE